MKFGPRTTIGYDACLNAPECADKKFIALQNGGWCTCDNTYSSPSSTYPKKPDNDCNRGGKGLGAKWRNAIYHNTALVIACAAGMYRPEGDTGDCRVIPTETPCIPGDVSTPQDCINTSMCKGDAPAAESPTQGYYDSPGKFLEYVAMSAQMSKCNRGDVRCAAVLAKPADGSEVFEIALE